MRFLVHEPTSPVNNTPFRRPTNNSLPKSMIVLNAGTCERTRRLPTRSIEFISPYTDIRYIHRIQRALLHTRANMYSYYFFFAGCRVYTNFTAVDKLFLRHANICIYIYTFTRTTTRG